MAKKTKTPPPPRTRTVQAPRQRHDPRGPRDRRLLMLAIFAASGVAMLVGVIAFLTLAGGTDEPEETRVNNAMRDAGCTVKNVAPQPYQPPNTMHIPSLATQVKWNTDPPAGGAHYGQTAIWNFYEEPVNPKLIVHNEEHGGVILWWGPDVDQATIERLRDFYQEEPVSMLATPYPSLGNKVAITAWTGDPEQYGRGSYTGRAHAAVCSSFNEDAFRTFRDTYRGRGPEGIPMDQNQPGT